MTKTASQKARAAQQRARNRAETAPKIATRVITNRSLRPPVPPKPLLTPQQRMDLHLARVQNQMRNNVPASRLALAYGGSGKEYQLARAGNTPPFSQLRPSDLGDTPSGRQWALTALHPCGKGEVVSPAIGDLAGMPDTMTGAVVTPAYPGETYIRFDPTLFPSTPGANLTTWGIDIVFPPIPEIDYLYRLHNDNGELPGERTSTWRIVRIPNFENPPEADPPAPGDSGQWGVTMGTVGYGQIRCIGSGHTLELDASATNDQGRVVVSQLAGQWTDYELTPPATTTETAAFVTDVGPPVMTGDAVTRVYPAAEDVSCKLQILSVPTDPSVLVSACPSSYQGLAKHGAYVVSKFSSPLLGYPFARTADNTIETIEEGWLGNPAQYPSSGFAIKSDSYQSSAITLAGCDDISADSELGSGRNGWDMPFASSPTDSAIHKVHPCVSGRSQMMTTVVTFRNLVVTPAATAAGATALVRVKSRNYFEAIPHAQNPGTTPFTHLPAPYDMKALEAVIVTGKQLADGYPACYNDLGQILSSIASALEGGGKSLMGAVKSANVPILSDLAGVLQNVL